MSKKNAIATSFGKWRKDFSGFKILHRPRRCLSHRVKMVLKYWLDERVRVS